MADKSCRRPHPAPSVTDGDVVLTAELIIEQMASSRWLHEPNWSHTELPGWMRFKKIRISQKFAQSDVMFMSPAGSRFRSLVSAIRYAQQHDKAVECSDNEIYFCEVEWPGCETDTPGQLPDGIAHRQSQGAPPPPHQLPEARPGVWYKLNVELLRPACTSIGCSGEAQYTPEAGPSTFTCKTCDATLQSQWWAHLLTRGSIPCYEDESDRSKLAIQTATAACSVGPSFAAAAATTDRISDKRKPPGRVPAGFEWDCDRGVWVNQKGEERQRGAKRRTTF